MKNRNLLSNILYIIVLIALAGFLIIQFEVLKLDEMPQKIVSSVLLAAAVISVAFVEIVFPVLDNKPMLKERKYIIMTVVKSILFAAALIVLFLYEPFGIITNMPVALVGFLVLYFVQFFINLDPKPAVQEDEEDSGEAFEAGADTETESADEDSGAEEYTETEPADETAAAADSEKTDAE